MPRKSAYVPWSSKNCELLGNMSRLQNEPDFRTGQEVAREKYEGRAHSEEAVLIQQVGKVNKPGLSPSPCNLS